MNSSLSKYKRHRFTSEIIQHAFWLYYRFNLSYRDVEDLLAERGIIVSYEAIRLWCNKFGLQYAQQLKRNVEVLVIRYLLIKFSSRSTVNNNSCGAK